MSNYSLKRFIKSTLRLESYVAHYRLMSIFPPYLHQVMLYKLGMCGGTVGFNYKNILDQMIYHDIVCTIARAIEVVSFFVLRKMESEF